MNEEEAIERIKKLIKWFEKWDDDYTLVPCDKVYFETVLNLIEKQQSEIERLKLILAETNAQFLNSDIKTKRKNEEDLEMLYKGCQEEIETLKRDFEIVDHECSRLEQEDIKKDMIINKIDRFKTFMVTMIDRTNRDSIDKNKVIEMFMEIDNILKGK